MAWRIFLHSIRMVFFDLSAVLRVSAPLIGVVIIAVLAVAALGLDPAILSGDPDALAPTAVSSTIFVLLMLGLAYLVALLWTAVAWHRYALLSEYPQSALPPFHGRAIARYALSMLLLAVLFFLVAGAAILIGGGLMVVVPGVMAVLGVMLFFGLLVVAQRLSIILPASAIGAPLSLGEAWNATRPYKWVVLWVLLLTMVFGTLLGLVGTILELISPLAGFAANLLTAWLNMLVTLSILTTLYGLSVEGRSID